MQAKDGHALLILKNMLTMVKQKIVCRLKFFGQCDGSAVVGSQRRLKKAICTICMFAGDKNGHVFGNGNNPRIKRLVMQH